MLKEPNHIDSLFDEFLHDYEENVPSYAWNNIQSELKTQKKMRFLQKLRTMAASAAILIAFGLGYFLSDAKINKNTKILTENGIKLFYFDTNLVKEDSSGIVEKKDRLSSDKQNSIIKKFTFRQKTKKYSYKQNGYIQINTFDSSYLFRKYSFVHILFEKEQKNEHEKILAISAKTSNQLLTDTLLLRKENLRKEGFPSLKKDNNRLSAWSFGTKFSPVFSVEDASSSQNSTQEIKSEIAGSVNDIKPDEKALTSFTGGINVNYQINKRVSIESGIFYLNKKQSSDNLIASQDQELSNSDYTIYTPEQSVNVHNIATSNVLKQSSSSTYYNTNANYIANAEYIELPLIIRYRLIDQKLGLDILSGVSTNFLVNNNSYILSGNEKLWSDNPDLNSVLYGASIGLGINYRMYQNFSFNFEPTFKYSFLSDNSIFRKYPYSFAIFAGFSFHF